MKRYGYDDNGYYIGSFDAQIKRQASDEEGIDVYYEYPNSTDIAPSIEEGYVARWNGTEWAYSADTEKYVKYLNDTDWVDIKIDELYKIKLVEVMVKYGSMTDEAWSEAISYLATLQNQYSEVIANRRNARTLINQLSLNS